MSHEFHSLIVKEVVQETPEASTLYFDIPEDLQQSYAHKAGQYVTIKMVLKESEVRRSYSICTGPHEERFGVNVKRVKGGLVSNHLNDQIKAGDTLEVMVPDGQFVLNCDPQKRRDLYFFAAGSGITPVISLIKSVLENEPKSTCYLCYGNSNEESIIFKSDLAKLEKTYAGQLFVKHTLSRPKKYKEGGLKGLFSRGKIEWQGWVGRIEKDTIDKFIDEFPPHTKDRHYFVCGPGAMIDTLVKYLEDKGIEEKNLHREYFISSQKAPVSALNGGVLSQVKVHLAGKEIQIQVPPEKTILDVLIDEKYDPPYSCTSGACSTCVAKLIDGKVDMDVCYALDDSEVKAGYILVCQSRAKTPSVELKFES